MLFLTYQWHGFHPSHAWDAVSMTDQTVPVKTKSRDGITFEPAKPGATLADVNDWMLDHGQHILSLRRISGIGERHGGTILALIGTEQDRQRLPHTVNRAQITDSRPRRI
jgi:hypothetical protein